MSLSIVPRATIGVTDPGARQHLAPGLPWLLAHYTGSPGYNDPGKDLAYAKTVAAFGRQAGKPYEYNYIIGLGGTVFEYAGDRLASHCLNFNAQSHGVLLMLGVGVQPTAAMISAFRELRAHLVTTGQLSAANQAAPHYRFRDTACPGSTVATKPGAAWASPTGQGRLGDLLPPFLAPAEQLPPPIETIPPAPAKGRKMLYLTFWQGKDGLILTDLLTWRYVGGGELADLKANPNVVDQTGGKGLDVKSPLYTKGS